MAWPSATDFIEAVQDLRVSVEDEELRGGEVVRTPLGLPMLWSGNFADVYKIHCPATGNTWALKCFTRQVQGLQERYRCIAAHLEQAQLPFTVDFQYLEHGIRIGGERFPVLKMRWVEGLTLNQFVEEHLERPAEPQDALGPVGEAGGAAPRGGHRPRRLAARQRDPGARWSGGSLALRLIDYDGMYVPALAGTPSGEVGHPGLPASAAAARGHLQRRGGPLLAPGDLHRHPLPDGRAAASCGSGSTRATTCSSAKRIFASRANRSSFGAYGRTCRTWRPERWPAG